MGLIVGPYFRGDPNTKPGPWGNVADVSAVIGDRFENLYGVSKSAIERFYPLWSPGGGDHQDYSQYRASSQINNGNPTWSNNRLILDGDDTIRDSFSGFKEIGTGDYTVFADIGLNETIGSSGIVAFDLYNPTWAMDSLGYLYIYDGGAKANSLDAFADGERGVAAWSRSGSTVSQYVKGRFSNTVTHSDSISVPDRFIIGSDRYGSGYEFYGDIFLVFVLSVSIAKNEMEALSDNPYALIQPPTFRTYFDLADSPLLPINVTANRIDEITKGIGPATASQLGGVLIGG